MISKKTIIMVSFLLFLSGCAEKEITQPKEQAVQGCEAVNLNTLLLSKSKAVKFVDLRSDEERNYHNSLWKPLEYCKMSDFSLNQIIAEVSDKTNYQNLITTKKDNFISPNERGSVTLIIENTNKHYKTHRNFNFLALKGRHMRSFSEGQWITLGRESFRFISINEYNSPEKMWQIKVISNKSGKKDEIINLRTNYFWINGYKIIF